MIKEHGRVVLKASIPAERLEAGDVGTVVHVYSDGKAYEVEFVALDGHTAGGRHRGVFRCPTSTAERDSACA